MSAKQTPTATGTQRQTVSDNSVDHTALGLGHVVGKVCAHTSADITAAAFS